MCIHFRQSMIRRLQVERAALDLGLEGNISTFVKLVSGFIGSVYSLCVMFAELCISRMSSYHDESKYLDVEVSPPLAR